MAVLDAVAAASDNVYLTLGGLVPRYRQAGDQAFDPERGWTFHNHNFIGAKMVKTIFRRMKFPLGTEMSYVAKLVELHMRPIALVEDRSYR